MRVIAGTVKGARLCTPKNRNVRPTLDRVRESLFSILGPDLEDARFLDLFAGTGANGVEALSRGAVRCDFVDNDGRALELIRKNLRSTSFVKQGRLWRISIPQGLRKLTEGGKSFDIVFADPPHKFNQFNTLFQKIEELGLLAPEGVLVVEHDERVDPVADDDGPFACFRRAAYGSSALSFFARSAAP